MTIFHDTGLERSKPACQRPAWGSVASVWASIMDGEDAVIGGLSDAFVDYKELC
jgi:hypothetical protein